MKVYLNDEKKSVDLRLLYDMRGLKALCAICTADKYWVGLSKEEKAFVGYARLMRKIDNMSSNMIRWILHTINHISLFYDHWYFVSKIVLTLCEKNIVVVIEKNFWNSRLKGKNLQKYVRSPNHNLFEQWKVRTIFETKYFIKGQKKS